MAYTLTKLFFIIILGPQRKINTEEEASAFYSKLKKKIAKSFSTGMLYLQYIEDNNRAAVNQ